MAIRDRVERGESPEDAAANSLREFGNAGIVREGHLTRGDGDGLKIYCRTFVMACAW